MNPSLQSHPRHPHGVFDPVLSVHDEFLGDDVNHFSIHRNGNGAGRIDHPLYIILTDLSVFHSNHTMTVDPFDMPACDSRIDRGKMVPCHQLCFLDRLFDRMDGAFDIDHDPFP